MDNHERTLDEQVGIFADIIRQLAPAPEPEPEPDPLWRRAATTAGGFLLGVFALVALAGLLSGLAAAARFGWNAAG